MGRTPFAPSERCPCDSGESYERCCFTKGFHFFIDEETGDVLQSVPLTGEAQAELKKALEVQREKFIAKFGREPGPSDPIFFDVDEDAARESTWNALRAAGFVPAFIYAYEETGLLVTAENKHLIADVDLREFSDKVREYYELIDPSADPRVS